MKIIIVVSFLLCVFISNVINNNLQTPQIKFNNVEELDESLIAWEKKGFYMNIFDHNVFGIHLKSHGDIEKNKTCIILHGFPSSSFEYSYGAAQGLQDLGYDVILHDHVGFGFSDKPLTGFGYSIHDHADIARSFYQQMHTEIRGEVIFISHDMGDSVLTELLTRYERDVRIFPTNFIIERVIFTNGGMYMKEASLRLSQRLLSSRFARSFSHLMSNLDPAGHIAHQQLKSVFSDEIKNEPLNSDVGKLTSHQIQQIQDLLNYKGGNVMLWRLSRYLQDRYACEERWIAGMKKLEHFIPIHFIWASNDSVAPVAIPKNFIREGNLSLASLTIVEGRGHFWMLEKGDGEFWAAMMHRTISGNL